MRCSGRRSVSRCMTWTPEGDSDHGLALGREASEAVVGTDARLARMTAAVVRFGGARYPGGSPRFSAQRPGALGSRTSAGVADAISTRLAQSFSPLGPQRHAAFSKYPAAAVPAIASRQ